jgi:coenzyme PQQ precursor peptide PqqA
MCPSPAKWWGELYSRCPTTSFARNVQSGEDYAMKWKTPRIVEIAVGMEINCYACAEI